MGAGELKDFNDVSTETYCKCAVAYEAKFMDISPYKDSIDAFCTHIPADAAILDLGCGPGNISKYLFEKGFRYITGMDRSPEMVSLAAKNVPEANFIQGDIRHLSFPNDSFHGVIASFCIPYISYLDTEQLLARLSRVIADGGKLYLSCMEGIRSGFETTSFSGTNRVYIYYYSEEFLREKLQINGFKVLQMKKQLYPEADGTFSTDLLFIAEKDA